MFVSFFARDNRPQATAAREEAWSNLVEMLSEPDHQGVPKKELPLWSAAKFRNDYRKRENVESVHLLTFDVDVDPIPSADALRAALDGRKAIVHSSSRATHDAPRWRVALALSRPVSADEYDRLWNTFASDLAPSFAVGTESKDPSRGWYFPRRGPDGFFEIFETAGEVVDVEAWLARAPVSAPALAAATSPVRESAASDRATRIAATRAGVAVMLGKAWPATGRHAAQLALAGALRRDDMARDDALEFLCDVCRVAGDEDRAKREKTIEHTWAVDIERVTGWSTLESHVDRGIVGEARRLMNVHAADMADLKRTFGVDAAVKESVAEATTTGLGFEFGGFDIEPPPTTFLVEGLIPEGSVGMLYGHYDTLKTWLAFSMAISIATGKSWLGAFAVPHARRVGIVDEETGRANTRRRLYMLRAGDLKNLGTKSFAALKPNDPSFWRELTKARCDIVFIDSLRKANPGANENDSEEAIVPLTLAAEFSEATGCAVVFLHHAKKAESDGWPEFRGASAIADQVDFSFVVRKADEGTKTRKRIDVKCRKPGDMPLPEPFSVDVVFDDEARLTTMRLAEPVRTTATEERDLTEQEIRAAIRLALSAGPLETKEKIKAKVRGKTDRVYAEIEALKVVGEIKKIENVGYVLDNLDARRKRVFAQVRDFDGWTSPAKLADAAFVGRRFVEGMIREGLICRRATGDDSHGYMIVER